MDKTPNRRPGLCSALAALAVLLVVLGWLFSPAFSGTEVLFTEGKTLGQWDAHLRGGAWDNQSGLGQPQVETRRGVSGLIQAICKLSPDPAANFANYHPLTCLLLLGMAAWLCARQLGTDSIVCGVVAIAAAFNGFFLTQSL